MFPYTTIIVRDHMIKKESEIMLSRSHPHEIPYMGEIMSAMHSINMVIWDK